MTLSKKKIRQYWLWVHLVLGLSAGLVLALAGLTGALLVFVEPLAKWENGDILFPENIPAFEITPEKVDAWLKAVENHPTLDHVEGIEYPNAGHIPGTVPILFSHAESDSGEDIHLVVSIHPETDKVIGSFVIEEAWWVKLIFFHFSLFVPFGIEIVSWATLLGFVSLLSGIVLWWPKKNWRSALSINFSLRGKRAWLRWHNLSGIYLIAPTIVLLYSGLAIVKPHWVDPIWKTVYSIREFTPPQVEGEEPEADHDSSNLISLSEAVAIALRANPGLVVRTIYPENEFQKNVHFVGLMPPEADPRSQHTEMWIDTQTGQIIVERPGEDLNFAEWVKSNLIPLHSDVKLGVLGQVLVFASGMSLPFLFISGCVLWWKRKFARSHKEKKSDETVSEIEDPVVIRRKA